MIRPSAGSMSRLALLTVIVSALGLAGVFWRNAFRREDLGFLPRLGQAEWIVYPTSPRIVTHQRVEFTTVFRCGVLLKGKPARASARVAGFRGYSLAING